MSEANAQEPSMEEILASIRRIISDDGDEPTPTSAVASDAFAPEDDDVLELNIPAMASQAQPAQALAPEPLDDDLETFSFDLEDDLEIAPETAAAPIAHLEPESSLVNTLAQAAAASAFDRLAQTVAMPLDTRTLEDVVRELLRPLLKAWLDENLLPIVQAKVDEEVERIARRRF